MPVTRVGLVFDDALRDSVGPIAETFETHGLHAVLAVVAEPEQGPLAGKTASWETLRALAARGHQLHPHGLDHRDEREQPLATAQARVAACFDRFRRELPSFDPATTVFHYPYNSTTPELDAWLRSQVRATRVGGSGLLTAAEIAGGAWTCACFGPGSADEHLHATIERALAEETDFLLYLAHGLDGEGWGPLGRTALAAALQRITRDLRLRWWDL